MKKSKPKKKDNKPVQQKGELNQRQRKFCQEYVNCGVADEAALLAGYSKATARANAAQLLAKTGIKNYIDELNKKIEDEKIMSAKEIQQMLTKAA